MRTALFVPPLRLEGARNGGPGMQAERGGLRENGRMVPPPLCATELVNYGGTRPSVMVARALGQVATEGMVRVPLFVQPPE